MNSQIRVAATHAGSVLGGAAAAIAFMSSHSVDIYAIVDQVNVVVADITKLVALLTPLCTGAYAVYKASTKQQLATVIADPKTPEAAKELPVTSQALEVADALKKQP